MQAMFGAGIVICLIVIVWLAIKLPRQAPDFPHAIAYMSSICLWGGIIAYLVMQVVH